MDTQSGEIMILNSLTLQNFSSFFGEHVVDFSIDDGGCGSVILIHGQTGSGKTSITSALQWLITGETRMAKKVGENRTSVIRHHIMFGEKKLKGSLLNLEAFEQGDTQLKVEINFTHECNVYKMARKMFVEDISTYDSKDDVSTVLQLSNLTTGENWEDEEAQIKLNSIIPRRLLQFFVVEGDFIEKYTETLFGSVPGLEMHNSVNDAVGIEAIRNVTTALKTVLTQTEEHRRNINDKSIRENEAKQLVRYYKDRIRQQEEEYNNLNLENIDHIANLRNMADELQTFEGVKQLLLRKARLQGALETSQKNLPRREENIRKSMNDCWRMVMTPIANNLDSEMSNLREIETNLTFQLALKQIELNRISGDDFIPYKCPGCGKDCEECKKNEVKPDLDAIEKLRENIHYDEGELEKMKGKIRLLTKLSNQGIEKRKIGNFIESVNEFRDELENIDNAYLKLEVMKGNLEDAGDDEDYQNLLLKHNDLETLIQRNEEEKKWIDDGDGNDESIQALKSKLSKIRKPTESNTNDVLIKYDKRIEITKLLVAAFSKTESTHLERMRRILDDTMTETFRLMITDPNQIETHYSLQTDNDWSVSCKTKTGSDQPIDNPGTQRKATLAYLEALRNCSGVEFPIILDNPAAPLEDEAKIALANHFVGDAERQTILLTHSGGWSYEALMENYGTSIARAYKLEGEGKIGEIYRSNISPAGGGLQ